MGLFGLISRMSHVMSHGICDATARATFTWRIIMSYLIFRESYYVWHDSYEIWAQRDPYSIKRDIYSIKRDLYFINMTSDMTHDMAHHVIPDISELISRMTWLGPPTPTFTWRMGQVVRDVTWLMRVCVCVCVCVMTWRDVICAHIHMTHITYGMTHIHISRRCTAQAPTFWVMKLRFGIIWFCTGKIESHDLVGFRSVEFLVESFICVPSDVLRLSFAFSFDGI